MSVITKILLVCCLYSLNMNAQIYFNKNYEYNSSEANATSIIETIDGYIFPSCIYSSAINSFLIVKIDLNGDTLWTKEYKDTTYIYSTGTSNSIIKTFDNNFIFCGARLDDLNGWDAFLVKFDNNGDTLWTKSYGGPDFDNANTVCQTADSGFVLMGSSRSFSGDASTDFYLIKTDKNGVSEWQQTYGTTVDESCYSAQITLDGGLILSGAKSNMFHIVKTSSNGVFQWQQTYSGEGACFIKQLSDSSYILTGTKLITGFGYQAYLLKVNKNGGFIWQKNYGGTNDDWFYTQPVLLSDGSIVIAGQTLPGSYPIGLLIKTDSMGNQQWLRTYYKNSSGDNYFYDLKSTIDNGFVMSGFSYVATLDPWVVKTDQFGCDVSNCNVGINESHDSNSEIKIYPNPAHDKLNIELQNGNFSASEICITNILGELQKIQIINSAADISQLLPGLYFISVKFKDSNEKLIKKFVKN
jgi:hypothetical protein